MNYSVFNRKQNSFFLFFFAETNLILEQVLTFKLLNKFFMNETEKLCFMPSKATKTTCQSEGLRKHGAESSFDTKDKRDQSTIPGTSKTLGA